MPRSSTAALRIVEEFEVPTGDIEKTRNTMAGWSPGQRRCRSRGRHNWNPFTVYQHRNFFDVVEQCSHCRNRRHAHFIKTKWGLRKETPWMPDYRDGYLLQRGAVPLRKVEELMDELTEADILSRRIVEVRDDDE